MPRREIVRVTDRRSHRRASSTRRASRRGRGAPTPPTCASSRAGTATARSRRSTSAFCPTGSRELGRGAAGRPARTGDDRAQARRPALVRCASRSARSTCPTRPFARARRAPASGRTEAERDRGDRRRVRRRRPARARNRALIELVYSAGLRAPRPSASTSATSTSSRSSCTSARARAAKDRVVPLGEQAANLVAHYLHEARPQLARGAENALFLSARGTPPRHVDAAPPRPASTPPAPRVRDAPARGRRRPAHDPGAARPLVALDDADVQPRRRETTAKGLRPCPSAILSSTVVPRAARRASRAANRRRVPPRPDRARPRTSASRSAEATRRGARALHRAVARGRPVDRDDRAPHRRGAQLLSAPAAARRARATTRQPRSTLPRRPKQAAADAVARRGGAADRGRRRHAAARAARPGAGRAALRRRPAGLRGGRARQERRRPRRPARARARQGRQGARRPDRPARRRSRCAATSPAAARISTRATAPSSS